MKLEMKLLSLLRIKWRRRSEPPRLGSVLQIAHAKSCDAYAIFFPIELGPRVPPQS